MDEWFDCRRAVRDRHYRYVRNYRPDLGAYLDLEFRRSYEHYAGIAEGPG